MVDKSQETTHFGFQTVAKEQKADMVAHVFHSVASKYDVMNDLMSFGIHRLWKRFTIDCSGVRRGQTVLDLAGGTGDLTAKFSRLVGETGKVVLADINESMLKMGREKLRNIGVIGNVEYVQANAEALPFPDNTFDCITISFGLRNVTDKDKALRSMYRVLKPSGRLLVLEFSKPIIEPLSKAYDAYSFHVIIVGILRMPKRLLNSRSASVFTFTKRTLPLRSCATSSKIGVKLRQGPHHGAQKSITTGRSSFSNLSSVSPVALITSPSNRS